MANLTYADEKELSQLVSGQVTLGEHPTTDDQYEHEKLLNDDNEGICVNRNGDIFQVQGYSNVFEYTKIDAFVEGLVPLGRNSRERAGHQRFCGGIDIDALLLCQAGVQLIQLNEPY